MRRSLVGLTVLALAAGVITTGGAASAAPAPAPVGAREKATVDVRDELPNPLEDKRRALKSAAVQQVVEGKAKPELRDGSRVVRVPGSARRGGRDRYVELAREQTDRIFVVLAEFGTQRDPAYPDVDSDPDTPGPVVFDGPRHNAIPKPGPADNSTVWQPDYDAAHYRQLYFGEGRGVESLKTYYETQSSGRYSVDGQVTDWVKVPYNEARYGRNTCGDVVCSNTWDLLRDALQSWVAGQKAAGRTQAQITAEVKRLDAWDRYDFDGDGDFNEPDGYIDHFQIVHAGGDEADGDPRYGEDAIWSHRWYAYQNGIGTTGPGADKAGGVEIPGTGVWVADYTIQPENGGLSVFAHEYGHDLGLPDDYDTAGGPSNNTEWWTLMSQSRLNAKGEALGERAGDLGAWQKLQLGWLDYTTVRAGQRKVIDLGPEEYNSAKPQAAVVVLPDKQVTTSLVKPYAGSYDWWSGQGDDYDASLSRSAALPAGTATLTAQAAWNIEDCGDDPCDYAYLEVRRAGGAWTAVPGSITKTAEGNGIDGESGGWKPASFDLSAYAGSTVDLRFRYVTDGAAQGTDPTKAAGLFLDDIRLTAGGATVFTDGAETADGGWTADGFARSTATVTNDYANYYIAANRSYVSYGRYLRTGPYNFGYASTKPNLVEHFPYQQGVLIQYWDTSQADNNVSVHPGEGLNLVVDAHPTARRASDGSVLRNRIQLYDAPFGTARADSFTIHQDGRPTRVTGLPGNPLFDDRRNYDDERAEGAGVKLRKAGVKILVLPQRGTSNRILVG
ncbi:immune inhibitor A domain-containing protein [Amnibacterium setariae]|uniref:M6 family metalloprotease domain-containing protein n=1 Tax=Amnibacterium setariae TaxID=2306585 RepID=A0A3A1U324_9MICO|nr:immune inhibitor A domain-containing protein [Amnibacterium setariae]RIX30951.1 M6 family metalloprotease domain-containing protein [Amnibacterium setariae]